MSDKKHINYSAADIERYYKGLMTAKEMNALEKAALDDPFLADAIEGYAAPVNAANDIAELNKKIDERINENKKVIPFTNSNFTWLRIAALFIIIAGAGFLVYKSVFQNKKQEVAAIEAKDTIAQKNQFTDTIASTQNAETATTENKAEDVKVVESNTKENTLPAAKIKSKPVEKKITTDVASADKLQNEVIIKDKEADSIKSSIAAAPEALNEKLEAQRETETAKRKSEYNNAARAFSKIAAPENSAGQPIKTNYFRGQVTDANNAPLPFANVTIIPDNIGTYADAKGNFVLISPDSVMDVRIHSVGFENNTARLSNNATNNSIVLQQDTKNIPATVLNSNKINSIKRQNNITVEEPEPADGWYNYDTYITNNIKIPDEVKDLSAGRQDKTIPSNEVELSFDVNAYGEPVNIKVEKSVCQKCDEEAIRLLKEGPKWKKKQNKRAKVLVGFSQE